LLRDIADLLSRHSPVHLATEIALMRARALDLENPDDPAALERVDPDVAAAVRRIRGVTRSDELFRSGPSKAAKARRRRKGG
jgi:hypothetical protein